MLDFEALFKKLGSCGFPDIGDGIEVRPLLKTDDLRLIRRAFIGYCMSGLAGADEVKAKDLMKRMLRKVKIQEDCPAE